MIDFIRSLLAFIVVLGVLVFFHELGHYLAARWRGVVVEAFSIGFGPALVSWTDRHGTIWKLSALPLGGYVKMQGWAELPRVSSALADGMAAEGETPEAPLPGSFRSKSLGSRAIIVAAGPLANMILAFVLFMIVFIGAGTAVVQPVVSQVVPHSPAAAAGLRKGDRITAINGMPVKTFRDIERQVLDKPNTLMAINYVENGAPKLTQLTTETADLGGRKIGRLGIVGADVTYQRLSPPRAVIAAGRETGQVTAATLEGLWKLVSAHEGTKNLGGPLRIAQLSGRAATLGVADFLTFIALLSINLGLVNLIPIPILDGGHLLFYLGEALYGRPLPQRAQEIGLQLGAALLAFMIVFVTWNDLGHLGVVHWVAHVFG
jgi:regulator of sigma E protease